jgi:hypothetical protein
MPDPIEFEDALSSDFGLDAFGLSRELAACDREIQAGDPFEIRS